MHTQRKPLVKCKFKQAKAQRFTSRNGKPRRIFVIVRHGKRRICHRKSTTRELRPIVHGVTEFQQVDAKRTCRIKPQKQLAHGLLGAGNRRHFHHNVADETLRLRNARQSFIDIRILLLRGIQRIQLHAQL